MLLKIAFMALIALLSWCAGFALAWLDDWREGE